MISIGRGQNCRHAVYYQLRIRYEPRIVAPDDWNWYKLSNIENIYKRTRHGSMIKGDEKSLRDVSKEKSFEDSHEL